MKDSAALPANDNVECTITLDDILMLAVLFGIFAGIIGLLVYGMIGGPDDVVAMLRW